MDKYTVETNSYGDKLYYKNGKRHRDNGLPAVEKACRVKAHKR